MGGLGQLLIFVYNVGGWDIDNAYVIANEYGLHCDDKVSARLPFLPYKMAFFKRLENYLKIVKFTISL